MSDFDYIENGEHVIEDCKGAERLTDMYMEKASRERWIQRGNPRNRAKP